MMRITLLSLINTQHSLKVLLFGGTCDVVIVLSSDLPIGLVVLLALCVVCMAPREWPYIMCIIMTVSD
jgi:hypothetical protein